MWTSAILNGVMLFEVQDLSKRFGDVAALAGVSFHVRAGEILGLIGPNGAGKTTLFECLAGVLPQDAGTVFLDGQPLTTRTRTETLFYLPDAIAPWPSQTVEWALDFSVGFFGGRVDLRREITDGLALTALMR